MAASTPPRRRWRRLAALFGALILAAIVGCEPTIGPTFTTEFPARSGRAEGTLDLAALRVVLHDFTFRVAGLEVVDPASGADYHLGRVVSVDGESNAVRVDWLAGACESRVTILLYASEGKQRLYMQSHPTLGGMVGCPALGVSRSLIVRFKDPIQASDLSLRAPYDR